MFTVCKRNTTAHEPGLFLRSWLFKNIGTSAPASYYVTKDLGSEIYTTGVGQVNIFPAYCQTVTVEYCILYRQPALCH